MQELVCLSCSWILLFEFNRFFFVKTYFTLIFTTPETKVKLILKFVDPLTKSYAQNPSKATIYKF